MDRGRKLFKALREWREIAGRRATVHLDFEGKLYVASSDELKTASAALVVAYDEAFYRPDLPKMDEEEMLERELSQGKGE